jgi:hypothetical protein
MAIVVGKFEVTNFLLYCRAIGGIHLVPRLTVLILRTISFTR